MTRLYISADIEGVCSVVSPHQCATQPDRVAYDAAVAQMALEVQVVVETALEAGASHIVVNDSHYTMTNLRLDHLSHKVALLSGKPKRCAMSAGLDSSFDAAIYIGYHAKAGTHRGVLCHTFHSKLFDVSINGVSYGEGGVNALYASLIHQVPLILTSGDSAYLAEIRQLIPNVLTVETKQGLGFAAAQCHPWAQVRQDFASKTKAAMANQNQWEANRLQLEPPYELRMTFIDPLSADAANTIPGLQRENGTQLSFTAQNFEQLYQMLQSCYSILAYTSYLA